jgi:hypothetical protein
VKTRVSQEHVAEGEKIAAHWNHKLIVCISGTDDVEAVMDKEHATQVLIQMATCNMCWAAYIVGQLGTTNTNGRIIYTLLVPALTSLKKSYRKHCPAMM